MSYTHTEVKMSDNSTFLLDIETYDAEEVASKLNDPNLNMVVLGSGEDAIVVNRFSVTRITPVNIKDV